jgi:hypothetical protein
MSAAASVGDAQGGERSLPAGIGGVVMPRVSIILGCYNQGHFVDAAIRSAAAQTYRDFECVVVDDDSTDGSYERIRAALDALGDDRFRGIQRPANGGQMAMMLTGIDATTGPFVAFLDADDLWHPEFLERHVSAHMSECGLAALSCSNFVLIDADGTQLAGGKPNFINADPRRSHHKIAFTEEILEGETRVFIAPGYSGWIWSATSALMFRRTALNVLRPARPERIRMCADYYLAVGAHMLGGTVRIERSLGCYRLHGGNAFSRNLLLGGRTSLGTTLPETEAASHEEFIRCLCENAELLRASLQPGYVAGLLIELVGRERAIALAAINAGAKLILSGLPARRPARVGWLRRRLAQWLDPGS